ncbi:hypothetical protein N431DRAFT_19147 [Stipitochalara longipes BDJ]|nr:hypothetical protein N431DRAFT_19147 [Stipitochalara longipes BDJ]
MEVRFAVVNNIQVDWWLQTEETASAAHESVHYPSPTAQQTIQVSIPLSSNPSHPSHPSPILLSHPQSILINSLALTPPHQPSTFVAHRTLRPQNLCCTSRWEASSRSLAEQPPIRRRAASGLLPCVTRHLRVRGLGESEAAGRSPGCGRVWTLEVRFRLSGNGKGGKGRGFVAGRELFHECLRVAFVWCGMRGMGIRGIRGGCLIR